MTQVAAGEVLSAALFNDKVRRRIARASRTSDSSSTNSTTDVAVLRLDDIPLKQGRNYKIKWQCNFDTTTATNETLRGQLRYTIDGSSPTTSSAILPGSAAQVRLVTATMFGAVNSETDYTPTTDEMFSCLLCIAHIEGTVATIAKADTTSYHTKIWIDDMGDDPGNTGTNL